MAVEDIIIRLREDVSQVKKLAELKEDLQKMKKAGVDTSGAMHRVDSRLKQLGVSSQKVTNVFGRFRFELLSVMFFGMAVQRTMKSLLQPSLDLVSAFDIMNITLAAGFLPTALKVNDALIGFMDFFLSIPEPVREILGDFILFTAVLGAFATIVGVVGLGVKGLAMWFGISSIAMGGWILLIGLIVLLVAGLIVLWMNWDKVGKHLKITLFLIAAAIGAVLLVLGLAVGWIFVVVAAIIALIAVIKNWGKITDWLKDKWNKFKQWFKGTKFAQLWKLQIDIMKSVWKKFVDFIKTTWQTIKDIFSAITSPVKRFIGGVKERISGSRQIGGLIPHTGLYKLHAGETVVPNNTEINFAPNITVSATSNVDIDQLKRQLSDDLRTEIERTIR